MATEKSTIASCSRVDEQKKRGEVENFLSDSQL